MKFSATKEKLLEGLQQVQNVVSTRTTLPILSNVLLQAKEGAVHLTTTDLDVGVRGSFEANVDKAGATTPAPAANVPADPARSRVACCHPTPRPIRHPPCASHPTSRRRPNSPRRFRAHSHWAPY